MLKKWSAFRNHYPFNYWRSEMQYTDLEFQHKKSFLLFFLQNINNPRNKLEKNLQFIYENIYHRNKQAFLEQIFLEMDIYWGTISCSELAIKLAAWATGYIYVD